MTEEHVKIIRCRRDEIRDEQLRLQMELDGLTRCSPAHDVPSSDESANRKEGNDETDSISEVEDICKESKNKSKLFVPGKTMKRMSSNGEVQKSKKAKTCLNDVENKDDFHYSIGSQSPEKTSSASIHNRFIISIHNQWTVLSKRMDRIEKQLELKPGLKPSTSKFLPEVKSITSKSIFIGLRDVWIPDIVNKIDELKGDISALTEPKQ